ncbi:MAG: hypothetical protein HY352_02795 [Candidatus Omnitrophica bacterium]|nr:hypothetical protein [Candidatus Omnitrophota bacterium]
MTPQLTEREARMLKRARRGGLLGIALGFILVCAGFGYSLWSVQRFKQMGAATALPPAFDRPIARVETFLADKQEELRRIQPQTDLEKQLHHALVIQTNFSWGLLVCLIRFLIGNLLVVSGLIYLMIGESRRPLLTIIRKFQDAGPQP